MLEEGRRLDGNAPAGRAHKIHPENVNHREWFAQRDKESEELRVRIAERARATAEDRKCSLVDEREISK